MVAIGGAWRQSAAVGGRAPPSREPSGIFERHPPVYAVGFLYRVRGAAICDTPPARKSGKLHSGRIPQAGTTEPAHRRAMEFSEALKSPPLGGAGGGDGLADTTRPPQKRKPFRNEKRATCPLCGSGCPLGCVVGQVFGAARRRLSAHSWQYMALP